jgi:4-diphosphocytidyl-2-C-methyl-D-erythritol kinase
MSVVFAPAKLTLSLAVTGVRPDGLHELRAEMVTLSLADELTIAEGAPSLTVEATPGTRAEVLGEVGGNLITRALEAVGRTAAVHVVKRIPLGGGLGGGSSDAAAVLRWAGRREPGLALGLGSDVPFCVLGGRALVEGVGEVLTPLPFVARRFLLLIPPFGVNTGQVYAAWDARHKSGATEPGVNVLTGAALSVEPRLAGWRTALGALTGREPILAGSGSTWFVEGGLPDAGPDERRTLTVGAEEGLLVQADTVPAGWNGG